MELSSTGLSLFVDSGCTGFRYHFSIRHGRDVIKGQLISLKIPQCSAIDKNIQDYYLQISLIMLFSNTLVSFVAAIALASSVTASTTQLRRQENSNPGSSDCDAEGATCCTTTSSILDAPEDVLDALLALGSLVNILAPVGTGCTLAGTAGWYCTPHLDIQIYN